MTPSVAISPGIGVALEDSVPLAPGRQAAVSDAIVTPDGMLVLAAEPVRERARRGPEQSVALGPGIAVSAPAPAPLPAPAPEPAPVPAAQPVAAPLPATPAPASAPKPRPATKLVFPGGEGIPPVVSSTGSEVAFRLTGEQSRSQMVLGDENGVPVSLGEGDEQELSFRFYVASMVYGAPGIENVMLRFAGAPGTVSTFGLQLWEEAIDGWQLAGSGLWASGEAMGGDRFLAPIAEGAWHDAVLRFRASGQGAGYYELMLDGELIDAREGVSLIPAGSPFAQIEIGLLRDGSQVQGTSEIRLADAELNEIPEPAQP